MKPGATDGRLEDLDEQELARIRRFRAALAEIEAAMDGGDPSSPATMHIIMELSEWFETTFEVDLVDASARARKQEGE